MTYAEQYAKWNDLYVACTTALIDRPLREEMSPLDMGVIALTRDLAATKAEQAAMNLANS